MSSTGQLCLTPYANPANAEGIPGRPQFLPENLSPKAEAEKDSSKIGSFDSLEKNPENGGKCMTFGSGTSKGYQLCLDNAKLGIKYFIRGVDYWRYIEYPWVINNLSLSKGLKILDLGSSSCSLLPLALASKRAYSVYVTDIDEGVLKHIELFRKLGLADEIKARTLVVERQDAMALSYGDRVFDRVTAISVVEHFPNRGDMKAVKELNRVLKPGGLALLTVPFSVKYRETFVNKSVYQTRYVDKPVFYQRHYDSVALERRLIQPSGLRVRKLEYFGEHGFGFDRFWESAPILIKAFIGWARPVFSHLCLKKIENGALDKARAAFLVLEKVA